MSSRYITQVKLENFQDHSDTTIDFTKGINLIVGSSDAGKSAILRAINFVFHNNLKGDSFIRHGSSTCKVSIKFSDGVEVSRIKGDDVNSYLLVDANGDNHSFPKVGTSVPDEIKKQLGQPPLDDKKRPISYADQMSNLFLVDLSSTDLPRTLSELTGIQNLQSAAEQLSKNARSFDRVIKDKNDKIEKLKINLSNYDYVDKDLETIKSIEEKLDTVNSGIKKTNKARQFVIDNNKIAQEAKLIKKSIATNVKLSKLSSKFKDLNFIYESITFARRQLKSYKVFADEHNKLKDTIGKLRTFKSVDNQKKLELTLSLNIKNANASNFLKLENDIKSEANLISDKIKQEKSNLDTKQKELSDLIEKLKAEGNWCKSCNRPLT